MNLAVRFVPGNAVITSVTMDRAPRMLVRAFQRQGQSSERNTVEALSFRDLEKLSAKRRTVLATLQQVARPTGARLNEPIEKPSHY